MSKIPRFILASVALVLVVQACNMPSGGSQSPNQNQPDLAATITAQAALIPVSGNVTATASPSASATMVTVSQTTNCRTGPSTSYDIVISLNPGQTAVVVGKDPADNYWIINNPDGNGTCWLWGQNATVTGNTESLPQVAPPPLPPQNTKPPKPTKTSNPTITAAPPTATSTPGSGGSLPPIHPVIPILTLVSVLPSAPGNFAQSRTCAGGFNGITPIWIESVVLTWQASAGQTGYHIYKGGVVISTLPATATQYSITLRYNQGTGGALYDHFGIEAFNNAGASTMPQLDVPTCP